MDISHLGTKNIAEEGKWFRVELYGEKQDFWINVLGDDSDKCQHFQYKMLKKVNAGTTDKKLNDEVIDELKDIDIESAVVRINGITGGTDKPDKKEPVILNGRTIGNNADDYRYLLEQIPALKKWIANKAAERSNFLSKTKRD